MKIITTPISQSGVTGLRFTPQIKGGPNCIDMDFCRNIDICGGFADDPKGEPGSDDHNVKMWFCSNVTITGTKLGSRRPRGDASSR